MIAQRVTVSKKEGSGNIFTFGLIQRWVDVVKRRRGSRENILAINGHEGELVTETVEKADIRNSYYASVFSCERSITEIISTDSDKPFTVSTNLIRQRLSSIGRNKSVGPDGLPGDILKLGGEAIVPYLTRLLNINMNNNAIPDDWKKAIAVPIYKRGD
jgi:hypothetical protein